MSAHRASSCAAFCQQSFLPNELGARATQTSAGRNLICSRRHPRCEGACRKLIAIAGRRRGGHFTFRQLWQALALAITGAKAPSTLAVELSQGKIGLGTLSGRQSGEEKRLRLPWLTAVRDYAESGVSYGS